MNIYPIPAFTDNYIWAIIDKVAGVFDCIDPGEAQPVLDFATKNKLKLRTILLTHHHDDHIGGVHELQKAFPGIEIYGPKDTRIPNVSHRVQEHDLIHVSTNTFKVLSNPGHTSSHISYYEPSQGWLFCGDTLFSGGCGRVFDGTMEQLHHSMLLFKSLPQATKVFCAHEYTRQNLRFAHSVEPDNQDITHYMQQLGHQQELCSLPSTIELELKINPFLRTQHATVIAYAHKHGAPSQDSLEVFRVLRHAKNNFQ